MSKSKGRALYFFSSPKCTGCGTLKGWRRYTCPQCDAAGLCWDCCDYPVIVPGGQVAKDGGDGYQCLVNATAASEGARVKDAAVRGLCKSCRYQAVDTTASFEQVGDCATAEVVYVFVHGGGASRAMFREHAATITARVAKSAAVLLDLPGHGAKYAEPCNALACIGEILRVARQVKQSASGHAGGASSPGDVKAVNGPRMVYVGGSLGGYLGMEAMKLGDFGSIFDAAAILCAAQGVGGSDAGVAARVGLNAMGGMIASVGKTGVVRAMVSAAKANKHLDDGLVWRTSFTPGMFFDQSSEQVAILQGTQSPAGVSAFAQPGSGHRVLFMYGSSDHSSMQPALNAAAGSLGRTVIVSGGDHFFTHDTRFFDLVVDELTALAKPGEAWSS